VLRKYEPPETFPGLKNPQNAFAAGTLLRTPLGELIALLHTSSWIREVKNPKLKVKSGYGLDEAVLNYLGCMTGQNPQNKLHDSGQIVQLRILY